MPELKDLVQFALDKQPSKFKDAFDDLLSQRVVDKVDELKGEISANMFGEGPENDEDDIEDMDDIVDDEEDFIPDDEDLEDIDLDLDDVEFDFEDDEGDLTDEDDLEGFEDEDEE